MKDDRIYLRFILAGVDAIRQYLAADPKALVNDRRTQKAVLRELHELAESTQRISPALKDRHPAVPWANISGFRNIVVHDYLGIDLRRVQSIVENDLPPLEAAIKVMLEELG